MWVTKHLYIPYRGEKSTNKTYIFLPMKQCSYWILLTANWKRQLVLRTSAYHSLKCQFFMCLFLHLVFNILTYLFIFLVKDGIYNIILLLVAIPKPIMYVVYVNLIFLLQSAWIPVTSISCSKILKLKTSLKPRNKKSASATVYYLSLIHIWRCRRIERCRSRWSPYH